MDLSVMATKRKVLPPAKGQKRGGEYVAQAQAIKFGLSKSEVGDVEFTYDPTKTTWPANGWDHRRTTAAGYNRTTGILRIEFFTNGAIYDYGTSNPIPPAVARQFRRTDSPGRFINSTLEAFGYERVR